MTVKTLDIRDRATSIPVLAIQCSAVDGYLFAHAGFGSEEFLPWPYLILLKLDGMEAQYDPFKWDTGGRTLKVAHNHLVEHFSDFSDGDVVDVEFILKETDTPKQRGS